MQNITQVRNKKKRINQLLFGITLLVFPTLVFSQTGFIKGSVLDAKNNEPLIGVVITLNEIQEKTVTDYEGNFILENIPTGKYTLTSSYYAYKSDTIQSLEVGSNDTTSVIVMLDYEVISLEDVKITAKANRESENILLLEQKKAVVSSQSIGAQELSRKGLGDAETAVAKVSGISKQDGVKNVFIRGLEDRYNSTLLNGIPIPSEDPEYKNIALEIFGTDIIQSIGISKVFSAQNYGDVGGASIQINSKEMTSDYALNVSLSTGLNSAAVSSKFLRADGANYFGFAQAKRPTVNKFDFSNKLDPTQINVPINHSYKISGGKKFNFSKSTLSLFGVAMHANDFSQTREIVRNANTSGVIYQDLEGEKFSTKTNQIILGNIKYNIGKKIDLAYNFMMFHASNQYVGEFKGRNTEIFQDNEREMGYLRRQQMNDNLLFTHQVLTKWKFAKRWNVSADFSYNTIKGLEPDRRENYLSQRDNGTYGVIGSNRQKRFFSELRENDYAAKAVFEYKFNDKFENENSKLIFGYNGGFFNTDFNAVEYNLSGVSSSFSEGNIFLDSVYNSANYQNNGFKMIEGNPNTYMVSKNIHAAFVEGIYQVSKRLTASAGFRFDYVNMNVMYDVTGFVGTNTIEKPYYLPSLNLKYAINDRHTLRLGVSKTYTLPQSKEISPYQYVNINFSSEGNPKIKPSDNYNADLKWDFYMSRSEILSVGVFYKHIVNPIGRVDKGNSAGLLTYDNISKYADLAGIELELRKNLFSRTKSNEDISNKLSIGFNASYIFSNLKLNLANTPERNSMLMGSSPIILNADITYSYTKNKNVLTTALVANYYSDKIHTNGTLGFEDIIQKGITTLDYVFSYKLNRFSINFKAANLLNPYFKLVRNYSELNETITLSQYKKGVNVSIGLSFNL